MSFFRKLFLIIQNLQAGLCGQTMTIAPQRRRVFGVPKKEIEPVCHPIALTGQTALEILWAHKTVSQTLMSAVQVYADLLMPIVID